MRQRFSPRRGSMLPMTDDAHARANAEQLRLLREALARTDAADDPEQPAAEAVSAPSAPSSPADLPEPVRS